MPENPPIKLEKMTNLCYHRTEMKKLILYGGTFDPPHTEHIAALKAAKEETGADKIIVMPDNIPPHKQTNYMASAADRLEMCRLAFGDFATVSDYEILSEGKSYSYKTVEKIKAEYPDYEILFLMGTDMLSTFDKWKYPEKILENATPLLCERTGDGEKKDETLKRFKEQFGVEAKSLDYVGKELSSSEIKFRLMFSLPVDGMLKNVVYEYIGGHFVYKPDKFFAFVRENEKPKRIEHTLGVMLMAKELAKKEGAPQNKALLAALLHDSGKYLNAENFPECEIPPGTPEPVVHQYLGAYIAEKILEVNDEEVVDAIRYHTTGKENMTLLGKIIFTADMLERGRDYEGVEKLRQITKENFENGFKAALCRSLDFVKESGRPICDLTQKAYDYYFKQETTNGSN